MDVNLLPPLFLIYAENPSDSGKVYFTCIFLFVLSFGKSIKQMFGDEPLGDLNIKMVVAAKFTGSGGAVVAFCPDGPAQVGLLESACKKAGFALQ
ncbi:Glucuronokinase 1 [Carex littledalei]|uniref:Glucuronokinase 1 n=1 Tax=Carex littledalei TaxID=544730 RepID=A0A833RPN7_9POAL|nr:Glucuronokinase 1 [Carex littledalei]